MSYLEEEERKQKLLISYRVKMICDNKFSLAMRQGP